MRQSLGVLEKDESLFFLVFHRATSGESVVGQVVLVMRYLHLLEEAASSGTWPDTRNGRVKLSLAPVFTRHRVGGIPG